MRLIFMGTPDIAAIILNKIIESGKHDVLCAVTQPDKPSGRGQEMHMSPVKEVALKNNISVLQPEKASNPEFISEIAEMKPDIIVVAAYGKILKKALLDIPEYGCINVHASLLPKYRGASPIQYAIINDEKVTGVTIMHMAEGLDTGDIISSVEVPLSDKETFGTLHDKMAYKGADLLIETLDEIAAGTAKRIPQDEKDASYVSVITKQFGKIDFDTEAKKIECLVRALDPWPTAYTYINGKMLKIWDADTVSDFNLKSVKKGTLPGTILKIDGKNIYVLCKNSVLKLNEVQLEGKKRMNTADFLRGYKIAEGAVFGN